MGLTSKRISTDGLLDSPQEASTNNSPEIPKLASQRWNQQQIKSLPQLKCPRCDSTNTKFCYYNNYSQSQPRYFCRACRRHWTHGGSLRYVPVGGCRRSKHPKTTDPTTATTTSNNTSKESIFDSNETLIPQKQQQVPVPLGGESGSGIFSDILREVLLNPTPVLPASDYIASSSFENHMLSPPSPFLVDLFGKESLSSYDEIVDSFPMPPSSSSSSLSNVSAPDSMNEDGFISTDSSRTKKRRAPPSYMNGDGVLGSSPSYWNFWDDITGFVSFNGP